MKKHNLPYIQIQELIGNLMVTRTRSTDSKDSCLGRRGDIYWQTAKHTECSGFGTAYRVLQSGFCNIHHICLTVILCILCYMWYTFYSRMVHINGHSSWMFNFVWWNVFCIFLSPAPYMLYCTLHTPFLTTAHCAPGCTLHSALVSNM